MGEIIHHPSGRCRHEKYGRCSNEFWKIMKKFGKPGLADFICLVWQAKLEAMEKYHGAARRARAFGLSVEKRRQAAQRALAGRPDPRPTCPDFRPDPARPSQCGYYFLEACLLKFPRCPGECEDYLPPGDQRG